MRVNLQPGKYVVAVSGGVDSIVLLHLLAQSQKEEGRIKNKESPFSLLPSPFHFTVAHYDHGIRPDSAEDRELVRALAQGYGLPFVYDAGNLGPHTSEAQAREARYKFLHAVCQAAGAQAIITAHHQDDLLETVILNLLRGTGRRGLSSLKSTDVVKRPLLHVSKKELLRYAEREGLRWREDSTNVDERYARNYVRKRILPRFADRDREALLILSKWAEKQNQQITEAVSNYLHLQPAVQVLDRHSFIMLPHAVAREVMAEWLLQHTGVELSTKLLERLVVAAKTGKAGTKTDINRTHWLEIDRKELALRGKER